MRHIFYLVAVGAASILAVSQSNHANIGHTAERAAADLLPGTTVLYVECPEPSQVVDTVLGHPLRRQLESMQGYQTAMRAPEYRRFQAVLSIVEARLGMTWRDGVEALTAGGIYAGVDRETEGIALLVKSRDEETVARFRDTLIGLARDDAKNKGNGDPVRTADYRGLRADALNRAKFVTLGRWLLLTNKDDLAKRVVDNYLDQAHPTLARSRSFQMARTSIQGNPSAWAFADIRALRDAGVAKELFRGQAENPLGELLVGGLLSNLQKTPYATASLHVDTRGVGLALSVPHQSSWIPEAREYFFGANGEGVAPPPIEPSNCLFTLSAYRDISGMWLRAADLFGQGVNDRLAEANSHLSTLFAGKDFGEEILGAIKPELNLVVARQDFGQALPQPAIKLPAFALVLRLKDAPTMQGELKRIFQSMVGFFNVVGAQSGQPQLDLDVHQQNGRQWVGSAFVPDINERESRDARLHFNFSPTAVFVGERFVLSSTKGLAQSLAELLASGDEENSPRDRPNTWAKADLHSLKEVLVDNRGQLVAQNMLEEGRSKEEAEQHIDTILSILGMFRDMTLKLDADQESLTLGMQVRFADAP